MKPENGNRVYSVAAVVVGRDRSSRFYDSHVRYPHITARERYLSNISGGVLSTAPVHGEVAEKTRSFLKGLPFVFVLNHQSPPRDTAAWATSTFHFMRGSGSGGVGG